MEYLAQFSGVESSKFISDIYSALNVNQKISSVRQVITFGRVTPLTMEQYAARFLFLFPFILTLCHIANHRHVKHCEHNGQNRFFF